MKRRKCIKQKIKSLSNIATKLLDGDVLINFKCINQLKFRFIFMLFGPYKKTLEMWNNS